jgi:hypothetical protein
MNVERRHDALMPLMDEYHRALAQARGDLVAWPVAPTQTPTPLLRRPVEPCGRQQ